ncbi:HutD family protein [Clostridium sp. FP2]|uniref:HutD family protein n=1 Tax=Clostridium TaxID=1485 RepID=UPI0013E914D4|nr:MULTISPECIES: HutD family protein [Clostridium]MBW9156434.1 HutD family protein [Clostridium tagluense]MBZ9624278.1 HutD family protein [Clostridium sp. FP2]WLC64161.1 HutD family protein [Clostridium tagluense]
MSCNIEVIKKTQHKTSEWSGGTTTELYIYPVDSQYSLRNFKWRLSSAKVQVESSTFTFLQGISRIIMVLEGELLLEHENHHNATLKTFQQDDFSGEWVTKSFGKVKDFNLMMAKGYKGKLEAISVNAGEFKDINLNDVEKSSQITEAFYIVKGDIEIDSEINGKINLNQGDLAIVTRIDKEIISQFMIQNRSHEESIIIKASIFYLE